MYFFSDNADFFPSVVCTCNKRRSWNEHNIELLIQIIVFQNINCIIHLHTNDTLYIFIYTMRFLISNYRGKIHSVAILCLHFSCVCKIFVPFGHFGRRFFIQTALFTFYEYRLFVDWKFYTHLINDAPFYHVDLIDVDSALKRSSSFISSRRQISRVFFFRSGKNMWRQTRCFCCETKNPQFRISGEYASPFTFIIFGETFDIFHESLQIGSFAVSFCSFKLNIIKDHVIFADEIHVSYLDFWRILHFSNIQIGRKFVNIWKFVERSA